MASSCHSYVVALTLCCLLLALGSRTTLCKPAGETRRTESLLSMTAVMHTIGVLGSNPRYRSAIESWLAAKRQDEWRKATARQLLIELARIVQLQDQQSSATIEGLTADLKAGDGDAGPLFSFRPSRFG